VNCDLKVILVNTTSNGAHILSKHTLILLVCCLSCQSTRLRSSLLNVQGKKNRKLRRQDLPVKEIVYGGMGREEFQKAQETERQLQQQDFLMEQTRDRKNQLESYVYDIRNKASLSCFMLDLSPSFRLSV
jgi:hypothetical protein